MNDTGSYLPLKVETSREAGGYVITAIGELDMSTAEALDTEVRAAEASDAERIVIDLSRVTFMDSTGLQLLLQAQARSRADSDRLRLVRGPPRVHRVFVLTNTDRVLPFLD